MLLATSNVLPLTHSKVEYYYRFEFFKSKSDFLPNCEDRGEIFKVPMKFYSTVGTVFDKSLFVRRNLIMISIDPREKNSLDLIHNFKKYVEDNAKEIATEGKFFN